MSADDVADDDAVSDDKDVVVAPIHLDMDADGQATLKFGPMPIQDLDVLLEHLGHHEGFAEFRESLDAAIAAELGKLRAAKEGPL